MSAPECAECRKLAAMCDRWRKSAAESARRARQGGSRAQLKERLYQLELELADARDIIASLERGRA